MFEEANHCVAFEYVLETFPLDRDRVYNVHLDTDSMEKKEAFINKYLIRMTEDALDITSKEGKKDFIRNLVATNIVMGSGYRGTVEELAPDERDALRSRLVRALRARAITDLTTDVVLATARKPSGAAAS